MSLNTMQKQQRQMEILSTIRTLQFATRRHLMSVHDLGGIRNANRVLKELEGFTSVYIYRKEHVYYLNKKGRGLFGDEKKITPTSRISHALMRNEAWLWLQCPDTWQIEPIVGYTFSHEKKRIMPDASFVDSQNALHMVEIDRTQDMKKNEDKLKRYGEYAQLYKQKYNKVPIVHFFTISSYRKDRLEKLATKYNVYTQTYLVQEV